MDEAERLLLEWFDWWRQEDTAPAKPPKALHIRTVAYLLKKHPEDPEVQQVLGPGPR